MSYPSSSQWQALYHERTHPWTGENIARLAPAGRPSSPGPIKDVDRPVGSGWSEDGLPPLSTWDDVPPAPVDPAWSFDAREYPTGWLKADAVAASLAFNTAYDHALQWGYRVQRLDMHWHREHDYNLRMFGRGSRGDIAPDEVHDALDNILANRSFSPPLSEPEANCLHARIDIVWLRHSRAPTRLGLALHGLRVRDTRFSAEELLRLSQVVSTHCLVDFREVLICVDPRAAVIYGRTRETEGVNRRWKSLGSSGLPLCEPRVPDAAWDNRSEVSGSSSDEEDFTEPPYAVSRSERAYQIYRQAGRDYERVLREMRELVQESERLRVQCAEMRKEVRERSVRRDMLEEHRNFLRLEQEGSIEPEF
ncbi:hypothetical protein AURDEDRAFT_167417 [Auricularia subglabra TFB-10046 SS5]|nr:hypothetical protein AURDEDRAFT_167417 [Auricularia subglabra TFB-10046 SS5]